MNWNDLKEMWGRQNPPAWSAGQWDEIEREFVIKQRKLGRTLFWRDVREAVAGVFVAAVFANAGWQMGRGGWPIALSVLLMLGLSGFFVSERLRVRRQRLAAESPVLARLEAEIAEQRRQRRLLSGVMSWYVGPCLAAAAIFVVTVLVNAPLPAMARVILGGFMAAILAATAWGVNLLNRRAVREVVEPRLRELEELRNGLTGKA